MVLLPLYAVDFIGQGQPWFCKFGRSLCSGPPPPPGPSAAGGFFCYPMPIHSKHMLTALVKTRKGSPWTAPTAKKTDVVDWNGEVLSSQIDLARQIVEETGASYLHLLPPGRVPPGLPQRRKRRPPGQRAPPPAGSSSAPSRSCPHPGGVHRHRS